MADDNNPIEDKQFEDALNALAESDSEEIKSIAALLTSLRDAVVTLQEQMEGGDEEDDD